MIGNLTDQRMNTFTRICALFVLVFGGVCARADTLSLTNLSRLLQEAEICDIHPQNAVKELGWLVGKWACTDRVIRDYHRPLPWRWLQTLELDCEEDIKDNFFGSTNMAGMTLYYTFTNTQSPGPALRQMSCEGVVGTNFYHHCGPDGGFPFWLKRERRARPNWFILEQQDTGDVFLFRRMEQSEASEPGEERRKAPQTDVKSPP